MEAKKTFWADAAKAGAVIGLILVVFLFIEAAMNQGPIRSLVGLAEFAAFAILIYYFAKKRSSQYGNEGFSYSQSMGFIIVTMVFAGFLYGLGYFFMINYIKPELVEQSINMAMTNSPFATSEMGDMMHNVMTSPIFWIFVMILSMVIYGGILGLIVSAFTKRAPDVFADENEHE